MRKVLAGALACAVAGSVAVANEKVADTSLVANAVSAFGADLLRLAPEGNAFLSPRSVAIALGMTALGARGETRDAFHKVLRLPADLAPDRFHATIGAPDPAPAEGFALRTANRVYAQKGRPLLDEFQKAIESRYGASVEALDFAADPDAARATINGWVAARTEDRIKELLAPPNVRKDTRLVLVNAIHFKAKWATPFARAATHEGDFHLDAAHVAKVYFLEQSGSFLHAEDGTGQLLVLPYKGGRYEAVFFLPKEGAPALAPAAFAKLSASARVTDVAVTIPKVKLAWRRELQDDLRALGLGLALSDRADFSGMSPEPLKVSVVVHQSFLALDEDGTEAAAATAVVMAPGGAPPSEPEKTFRADRPFLLVIRDVQTHCPAFVGRIVDPRAE